MKRMLKLAGLGLLLAGAAATVYATSLPRLWEVSGKNDCGVSGKFYMLAVTHDGLDTEYDDYFYRTVIPLAMTADVFLHEKSRSLPAAFPACATPLADTAENRAILKTAYADVARAYYDLISPDRELTGFTEQQLGDMKEALHWTANDMASRFSEYGLITVMDTYLESTVAKHPEKFPNLIKPQRPMIARYLEHERLAKGMGPETNQSVDADHDVIDAYCNISGIQRGRYLQREIAKVDPAKFVPPPIGALARVNADFAESVQRGVLTRSLEDRADDELSRRQVCDRNDKWVVLMRQALGKDVRFYALGVSHLLQSGTGDPNRCDGLVVRLKKEGFSVTLLK